MVLCAINKISVTKRFSFYEITGKREPFIVEAVYNEFGVISENNSAFLPGKSISGAYQWTEAE